MASKFALLIGLNGVDPQHYADGWTGFLRFAEADVQRVKNEIVNPFDFARIEVLTGSKATRDKVLGKLEDLAKEAEAGDLLLIYYSGHGGQVPDENGDEVSMYDQTWCLFDGQLIDDELWLAWSKFKTGVRIVLLSDSCHSGTMARIVDEKPDVYAEMLAEGAKIFPLEKIQKTYQKNKLFYKELGRSTPSPLDIDVVASLISIAACKDEEAAYENPKVQQSEFTHALLLAWDGGKFQEGYPSFYQAICGGITKKQTPQLNFYGVEDAVFKQSAPFQAQLVAPQVAQVNPSDIPYATELLALGSTVGTKGQDALKFRSLAEGEEEVLPFVSIEINAQQNAWDLAYAKMGELSAQNETAFFIEPNLPRVSPVPDIQIQAKSKAKELNQFLPSWPYPQNDNQLPYLWHLDEPFSQLGIARNLIMQDEALMNELKQNPIRIGHLDTGYLDIDLFKPRGLRTDLGKNYVEKNNDARDRDKTIAFAEQQGHGAATLAILAGPEADSPLGMPGYKGYLGGIPFAEVIPIRVLDSVALLKTDAVALAIQYALSQNCEVITMSMGGAPSKFWAEVINEAYLQGLTIVAAAGNSFRKGLLFKQLPDTLVYPARFERVIGAAGITYNQQPYIFDQNDWEKQLAKTAGGVDMQGNHGPDQQMWHVMAAYTPNVFWTDSGEEKDSLYKEPHFIMTGGGTSSATPQIAAAAALWIVKNRAELREKGYTGTWRQVEAVRYALFKSAEKFDANTGSIANPEQKQGKYYSYYGQGALRAKAALEIPVPAIEELKISPPAKIPRWPILTTFWGKGGGLAGAKSFDQESSTEEPNQELLQEMLSLELMQLFNTEPALFEFARLDMDSETFLDQLDPPNKKRLLEGLMQSQLASDTLKMAIGDLLK